MDIQEIAPEKYRFERKFAVNLSPKELEMHIKLHPFFFKEIFYERWINNIYFDTYDLRNYFDNVLGLSNRLKVRVRWYDNFFGEIENPTLEFKIKRGMLGRKKSYKLNRYLLKKDFHAKKLKDLFRDADLPAEVYEELKELQPTLLNRYKRKYFLSADKAFRLTLDTNMQFFALKIFPEELSKKVVNDEYNVVELKYSYNMEKEADKVSSIFPFRVTKSSKYVDGIDRINNNF